MKTIKMRRLAALVAALAGVAPCAWAQEGQTLREVVVTATRSEAEAGSIPATVTTIDRRTLDHQPIADEADLFKHEPDVVVPRDLRRFGATRINIRGIEDNRVIQLLDGVRLPNYYNGGGPTNFTLSAPLGASTEFLNRIEILRGPASSLYGSDALGGVVGYLTLDVSDLLRKDERAGARYKLGYTAANKGLGNTVLGAWRGERTEVLLGYHLTDASEFDNNGDLDVTAANRTRPNPQDVRDQGAIFKFALRPAAGHRLSFTLDGRDRDTEIDVKRLSASLPKVTSTQGDDNAKRARASLEWQHRPQGRFYNRLSARIYRQELDTENFNRQRRTNTSATCSASAGAGNNCAIEQDFAFSQKATGGGLQFESALGAWGADHLLTYGADLSRVRTEQKRDARIWNLTTGTFTKTLAGDVFPLRDFAPGYTDTMGLFVQDEIHALADRLTITPALRYDSRRLVPEPDALSQGVLAAIGKQAVRQSNSAFSPKLAAFWRFAPAWSVYGQLVRGFRAPNYEEANGHFRNAAQNYGISPNPNLKPETSTGAELGLKRDGGALRAQLAVFDNRYRNFIESVRLVCPVDSNCITALGTTFMPVNLARVRIFGAEARAAWEFAHGWRIHGAIAHARGTDESRSVPLNSVEPTRVSLALARETGPWGAEARLSAAARKKRVDDTDGVWFRAPSYGVFDLSAWRQLSKQARLTLSATNLFDKKYWLWSDIRQADSRNPAGVDFYSQPGRALAASFAYQF